MTIKESSHNSTTSVVDNVYRHVINKRHIHLFTVWLIKSLAKSLVAET